MVRPVTKIQRQRDELYTYLVKSLDRYSFERGVGFHKEVLGLATYDDFLATQRRFADSRKKLELNRLEYLRQTLVPQSKLMDEEYMIEHSIMGYVANSRGQLVLLAPR